MHMTTASDGNHGAGLAWISNQLGLPCTVWLPKGAAESRQKTIRDLGAEVKIPGFSYDETVNMCKEHAEKNGWVLIQDTAWEGYVDVPEDIMSGYSVIMEEVAQQLKNEQNGDSFTHVVL